MMSRQRNIFWPVLVFHRRRRWILFVIHALVFYHFTRWTRFSLLSAGARLQTKKQANRGLCHPKVKKKPIKLSRTPHRLTLRIRGRLTQLLRAETDKRKVDGN